MLTLAGALGTLGFLGSRAARLARPRGERDVAEALVTWERFAARRGLRFIARRERGGATRPEVRLEGALGGARVVFDLEEVTAAEGRPVLVGPSLSPGLSAPLLQRTRVSASFGAIRGDLHLTRRGPEPRFPRRLPFPVLGLGRADLDARSPGRPAPAPLRALFAAEPRIASLKLSEGEAVARAPGFVSDPDLLGALLELVLAAPSLSRSLPAP